MHTIQSGNNLIHFPQGSRLAKFCRREKRFLVEVQIERKRIWVYCNNSGSMLGLLKPGAGALISPALNTVPGGNRIGAIGERIVLPEEYR